MLILDYTGHRRS